MYAAVSAQWTYDAYGAVIDEDVFDAASPVNRAGHKGLFADRLDVGVVDEWGHENCRLTPGAELAFYNRNRTYSPYLGRFLQSDPNATGIAVIGSLTRHGRESGVGPHEFNIEQHYGDGSNAYAYLAGDPWNSSDALGLYGTPFDTAMMGVTVGQFASQLVGEYAFNQLMDADWAFDWGSGDYDHSRLDNSWIDELTMTFLYENVTVSGAIMAGRLDFDTLYDPSKLIGKFSKDILELHHIIAKFLGGLESGIRGVVMKKDVHNRYHTGLNRAIIDFTGLPARGHVSTKELSTWLKDTSAGAATRVQDLRVRIYEFTREFDAKEGTQLLPLMRREFKEQRRLTSGDKLRNPFFHR